MDRAAAHTTSDQSLSVRYLTLTGGEIFSKICVLLAFAYLARALGPSGFGLIELSLSITLVFTLTTEFGLGSYGARAIAAAPAETPIWMARIIVLRAVLAVPAYGCILVISERYGLPGIGILAVYGLTVLLVPFNLQWVFQGAGRMHFVAGGTALRNLVFSISVFALIRPGSDPRWAAAAEVLGVVAFAAFNLCGSRRIRPQWRGVWRGAVRLLQDAWPLGASEIAWASLWYAPALIVGAVAKPADVAWVAGPVRLVMALHTFVWLYFFNLLPGLSRAYAVHPDAWRSLANRSLATSAWISGLVAIVGFLLAPELVAVIYGPRYGPAALPLRLVIWMIPIAWLSGHYRYSLIATKQQRPEFLAALAGATTSIVVSVVLVPMLGSVGGAVGLVTGGLVNLVLAADAVRRTIGPLAIGRALAVPAAIGGLCVIGGLIVRQWADGIVAVVVASAVFLVVAIQRDEELARLRHAWLGR